jgi:conjugal transfer pilus assembly protein TraI
MKLPDWMKPARPPVSTASVSGAGPDDPEIPRYPPFLRGLPLAPPARIIATQQQFIAKLQDGLAFTDERFNTLMRPVLERYAAFVHLLPASEAHHHRGAGGLFHHGLEVAFHAARASQGLIFALDRSPGERRALEPRWHLAAGLAGLCHDVGKPIADLSVTDRAGQTTWRPLLESLTDWAAGNGVTHYFLHWREQRHDRHEAFGLLVLERILTPAVTAWLAEPDPGVLQALLAAVAGIDAEGVLGRLVNAADQASVEQDLRMNHVDSAAVSLGVPVERYLLDAMRRLARGGRWQINVPGARLWSLAEGLHVVWPAGAEDVVALLAADKVPGIPRDPDTLADILLECGLAVPRMEEGQPRRYWRLAPAPLARDGQTITLAMLRLASPDLVLAGVPPAPVATVISGEEADVQVPTGSAVVTTPAAPAPSGVASPPLDPVAAPSQTGGQDGEGGPGAVSGDEQKASASPDAPKPSAKEHAGGAGQGEEGAHEAAAWLREQGAGGAVLVALAERLVTTPPAAPAMLRMQNGQLVILYPEGLAGLGAPPSEQLSALAAAGLLETDPLAPLRRVIAIDGRHGARLTAEASRRVLALPAGPQVPSLEAARAGNPSGTAPAERTGQPSRTGGSAGDAAAVARTLVARVRAGDLEMPGAVSAADGCLTVTRESVRAWADAHGVQAYALIRTLGHLPGCRITAEGGLAVRAEP